MDANQPELDFEGFEFPEAEVQDVDLDRLVQDLVADLGDEITPYKVATVVNTTLEAVGSSYRVRPQMMYNYDRNGMVVRGAKSKGRFTKDEVVAFVVRFVQRNQSK